MILRRDRDEGKNVSRAMIGSMNLSPSRNRIRFGGKLHDGVRLSREVFGVVLGGWAMFDRGRLSLDVRLQLVLE